MRFYGWPTSWVVGMIAVGIALVLVVNGIWWLWEKM